MISEFKQHVLKAAARPEVRAAVDRLYLDVQREIDLRRPICVASGKCCRFDEYGHRLFLTTMEMATFLGHLPEVHHSPQETNKAGLTILNPATGRISDGCTFQRDKLCTVHTIRPFGCRMFFCDATSTDWQNRQYERFHADLKGLHETLSVQYFYVEWRQALRDCLPISE